MYEQHLLIRDFSQGKQEMSSASRDATSSFFIAFTPSTVRLFKQSYAIIFAAENKKKGIYGTFLILPSLPPLCRKTAQVPL